MDSRTALLIDGANMFAASRMLRFHIDYRLLLDVLAKDYDIVRANYYTAIRPNDGTQDDPLIKLVDWLSYNGYTVITKPAKEYNNGRDGIVTKGNMDVEMALDAMLMSDRIDHFIIGSGDGDFKYLVDVLHRKGLQVSAISTVVTNPPMISSSLRREVDEFIELDTIRNEIERSEKG